MSASMDITTDWACPESCTVGVQATAGPHAQASPLTTHPEPTTALGRLADYLELTKPKIAVLELATLTAAAMVAGLQPWILLHALAGTALVAASASALNQWWERDRDRRMRRTATRPLPAGRLAARDVVIFGVVTLVAGVAYLAAMVNWTTAGLGLLSWVLYVLVYTPLKTRTHANTLVGAIAGAVPILMGWSAMGRPLDLWAGTFFLLVFLWQFPHFMAIAWIYRDDYKAAGMKMLTVVDPSGLRAGVQAVLAALVLVPVSLVPAVLPLSSNVRVYFAAVLVLGVAQLACAISFSLQPKETSARQLLRASLVYLPVLLMLLMLTSP